MALRHLTDFLKILFNIWSSYTDDISFDFSLRTECSRSLLCYIELAKCLWKNAIQFGLSRVDQLFTEHPWSTLQTLSRASCSCTENTFDTEKSLPRMCSSTANYVLDSACPGSSESSTNESERWMNWCCCCSRSFCLQIGRRHQTTRHSRTLPRLQQRAAIRRCERNWLTSP